MGDMVKVLHVDDEPYFLEVTKAFLERGNECFRIDSATSPIEAFKLLNVNNYDVIISDYQMPGMDGLEFLQNLREGGNAIPFIMLTGRGREEVAIEALNRGANHYLHKGGDLESLYGTLTHVIREVVEKKRAKDKLAAVEQEHQMILNSLPLNIFHINRNGEFVHVNKFLAERYGKKPEDFIGKSTQELFPDKVEDHLKNDEEFSASGKPQIGLKRKITSKDGERWVRLDKVPLKDATGKVTGMIGFELDITKLIQIQDALHASEEKYRLLIENANEAILVIQDGLFKFFNPKAAEISGYSMKELINKPFEELIHSDDREMVAERYHKRLKGERLPPVYSFRIISKEGAIKWLEVNAVVFTWEGRPATLNLLMDITERKKAEEALRASEEKYRTLVEHTGTAIGVIEEDTTISFVNNEYERLTGYTKEEVEGKVSWTEHTVKEDLETMRERHKLRRANESKAPSVYEFRLITKGREIKDILLHVNIIPGTKKSLTSLIDITERKRAEEALRASEKRYRVLLNNANDAVFVHPPLIADEPGTFIEVNDIACQKLGYTREELLQLSHFDIIAPEQLRDVPAVRKKLLAKERNLFEIDAITKDGRKIPFEINTHLFNLNGKPIVLSIARDITDRKRAEEALRESEERFRALAEDSPFGISIMNPDKRFEYFNPKFTEIFGYTKGDLPDKDTWFNKAYPDEEYRKKVIPIWKKDLVEGVEVGDIKLRVFTVRCKDGKDKIIRFSSVVLRDRKHFLTYEDITAQAKAEEALKESEKKLSQIVHGSQIPTFVIDNTHTITYWNKACERLTGLSADDMVGTKKQWMAFYSKERPVMADFVVDNQSKEAISTYYGDKCQHSDLIEGAYEASDFFPLLGDEGKWLFFTASPLGGAEGDIYGAIETLQDITEFKRVGEELLESEAHVRTILNSIGAGIMVIDAKTHEIVDANPLAVKMVGAPREQIVGHVCHKFVCPAEVGNCPISDRGQAVDKSERVLIRANGEHIPILKSVTPVTLFGRPHLLESFLDIIDRKKGEEERESLLKELEAKNAEQDRFTYTVSHDLRSPLFAIQGFASIAREDVEQGRLENLASDLERVESASKKMDRLLNDTLQLSRIGRVANPPEDVPFDKIVDGALELVAMQIKSSGVDVSTAKDFPTVHVDLVRIEELLENLIGNSIKYMGEQPSPKIEIGYRVEDDETVFFVKDNGIGIDPRLHSQVFELFYQANKRIKGTGAGLAIVKRIVEVHGGRIWIESEEGNGCTVCFTLPIV